MPDIHHALFIGAPVEKVYNAICSEEGLSGWWTPDARAKTELNSVARFPFGSDYFKEMKVTDLKPYELIKWNCISGADEWVGTTISFKLLIGNTETLSISHPEMNGQLEQQRNDEGTLLIFHHDDWKDYTLMFAECSYTWGQFLRSLKLLCETGKGRPWPNQHRVES
jgi:uncharacterized protein YndB with AHSA1/START domain